MKNYIAFYLILIAYLTVHGQSFEYGLKAGLNFNSSGDITNISNQIPSLEEAKSEVNGFNFGFYGQLNLALIYLRPEIYFSKFETTFNELSVGKSRIEAPISLGFKLLPVISAFFGPTYRYELIKENQNYTIESLKGDSTLGLHLGARIHLGKIGIEGRLERGVSENEAQLLSQSNINIGDIDNRTNVLSLGISYAF